MVWLLESVCTAGVIQTVCRILRPGSGHPRGSRPYRPASAGRYFDIDFRSVLSSVKVSLIKPPKLYDNKHAPKKQSDAIPDETTILKFRHMIERHTLSEAIFADINNYLVEKGIQVSPDFAHFES